MIKLNEQQQSGIDAMLKFYSEKNKSFFSLIGPAGTGKSTTIQHLIERLPKGTKICFTAPTNKAVRVLRKMAFKMGLQVECMTIYSLLGLKVTMQKDKEVIKGGGKSFFDKFDIVVIDEMSMINTELLGYIHRAVNLAEHTQVILMGDACQLPPVGESISATFAIDNKAVLTKVMRQRDENPILGLCTDIRHAIEDGMTQAPKIQAMTNTEGNIGVHIMAGSMFSAWMPSAFNTDSFDNNVDKFRVIAWRNKTVEDYNKQIQSIRYPGLKMPFSKGEPVVFSSPLHRLSTNIHFDNERVLSGWDDVLCSTESEGIIDSIAEIDPFVFGPTDTQKQAGFNFRPFVLSRYAVVCNMIENVEPQLLFTVTQDTDILKDLLNFIAGNIKDGSGFTWFNFWVLNKFFADIRPAYAMTAHKSQGSTFENVFIDAQDILSNPNREEALRCLYVAVSRASHNVVVNI